MAPFTGHLMVDLWPFGRSVTINRVVAMRANFVLVSTTRNCNESPNAISVFIMKQDQFTYSPCARRKSINRFALLGCYPPRLCGIATFSEDLAVALSGLSPDISVDSIAMSDRDGYSYPERVCHEVAQNKLPAYASAARYINEGGYDLLSIQHEYGIFGGPAGSYLMNLVRKVEIPIVTTLHTVLSEPSRSQRVVMDELIRRSDRVVVMSKKAVGFLRVVHNTPLEKIDFIHHGIPHIPESTGMEVRQKLGISGPMILTFGLLSPDKGIEYVIRAMPDIVRDHPGATYVVLGATHPHVRASSGESYRDHLEKLAGELGVADNVRFVDRFVTKGELVAYLSAMDIYVTPYLNPKQITSGTLAYAVGAGKAVISTPYWYAEELLAEGRGTLVPFRDGLAISEAILSVLKSPKVRHEMGVLAAAFGEQMLWPNVAESYQASFFRALEASRKPPRAFARRADLELGATSGAQLR
jgi:glycosyltransferase involved in cell wall biosynthesis